MGMNKSVEEYLSRNTFNSIKKESVPIKKELSKISSTEDWPDNPCISCRWWIALSPELNLGECRNNLPRLGKTPEKPEAPITPPNYFCRHHWHRSREDSTYDSRKR